MIKVLPSTNPCDENMLLDYSKELENLGVEYLHCDVMDGLFVENKCLSIDCIRNIRNNTNLLLDVHLMVANPLENVKLWSKIYPNIITVHYESCSDCELRKIISYLKSKDILVGISLKPNTPIDVLLPYIEEIDLVLIMSVEPGKSGQKFIDDSIDKIKSLKSLISDRDVIIEVDGGINENNYKEIVNAGANFLVMGSAFYNAKDKLKLLSTIDNHYKN